MTKTKDITTIATNSFELQNANQHLSEWVERKIAELDAERLELAETQKAAYKAGISVEAIRSRIGRVARHIRYYQKLQSAIDRGYAIVPNAFFSQTLAVRVKEHSNPRRNMDAHGVEPANLPEGEGTYVNAEPFTELLPYTDDNGKERKQKIAIDHDHNIEFPLEAAKVKLIEAAQGAMDLLLFDRIEMAGGRATDPMLIGSIKKDGFRYTSFIIAWWIDTSAL